MPFDTRIKINSFKTVSQPSEDEYTVQKSRFIAYVFPCGQEDAALDALDTVRRMHPKATHHCYAYIIGVNAGVMRYSDDGEPSGTAGLPILGVLQNNALVNVCAVVVRYFGGILLGTGGLVRAYSHACTLGVQKARIIAKVPTQRLIADIPYPMWDRIQFFLKGEKDALIEETAYGAAVSLTLLLKEEMAQSILAQLTDQMNGALDYILSDPFIHCWETDAVRTE